MNLKKALTRDAVCLSLKSSTKDAVIEELVDVLCKTGKVKDRKAALKAIADREKKMSTGMQNGVAIPHGKSDAVESLVAAIGIHPEGVNFDSLDGLPSRIFIMTLCPVNRTGPHIQFLAEISRLLNSPEARDRILRAITAEELLDIFNG